MTDNILILLAVLTAANVVLITIVVVRSLIRRRRLPGVIDASQTYPSNGSTRPSKDWTEVVSTTAPVATAAADPGPVANWTDPLTGLLLPAEWNRVLADEDARFRRYGRPATVVMMELDGLDRLVAVLGQEAGDRILPAVAGSISRHARSADQFARLGPGRFGILLLETGEVEAVNYIERVRQVCELWLESGAIALRLAIGWAAPPVDGSMQDAYTVAQERMFAELRRQSRRSVDLAPEVDGAARHGMEGTPSPA